MNGWMDGWMDGGWMTMCLFNKSIFHIYSPTPTPTPTSTHFCPFQQPLWLPLPLEAPNKNSPWPSPSSLSSPLFVWWSCHPSSLPQEWTRWWLERGWDVLLTRPERWFQLPPRWVRSVDKWQVRSRSFKTRWLVWWHWV